MAAQVFITGASSGLGFALAQEWLKQGAQVFGISRRQPKEFVRNANFRHAVLDLSQLDRIEPTLGNLFSRVRALHVVVLNAGVLGPVGDLAVTNIMEIREVMDVNVWSNKVVLDALFKLGLSIAQVVAISSGAALTNERGWNAYAISKAALNRLIALYAAEKPHTHFCAFAPGLIDTAMQGQISALPADERFASFDRLKKAKGTALMPKPEAAAAKLIKIMMQVRNHPSGSFLDARQLSH